MKKTFAIGWIGLMLAACGSNDLDQQPTQLQAVRQSASKVSAQTVPSEITVAGYRRNFIVSRSADGVVTLKNLITSEVTSYPSTTRLLKFFDLYTSFDVDGDAGDLYRVYQAAFNRKPDLPGLGFWINARQNDPNATMLNIAHSFLDSDEFKRMYGANPSAASYVTALYNNVLHRAPEQQGYEWWLDVVSGGHDRGDVLLGFARSDENKKNVNPSIANGFDYAPWGGPIRAAATSYANAKEMDLSPLVLPKEAETSQAYARADFKLNGKMMLFTTKITYRPDTSTPATATPSVFAFWSQENDGSWIRADGLIDSSAGCVHPRKAVVADFNLDGVPDVLVACQGYDAGTYPGEKMWMVMSTKSGVFHSAPLQDFVGFFHSVAAADLNRDGYVDLVAVDPNSPQALRMFLNKGDGTFTEVWNKFPSYVLNHDYYTVELLDVDQDGEIDMLIGGHDWQEASKPALVLGDGTDSFAAGVIKELPTVPDNGVVLDFLVANNAIYVNRTSGGGNAGFYQSKVIQKIDWPTMSSSVPFIKYLAVPEPGEWYTWFPWLLRTPRGVRSDNLKLSTDSVN